MSHPYGPPDPWTPPDPAAYGQPQHGQPAYDPPLYGQSPVAPPGQDLAYGYGTTPPYVDPTAAYYGAGTQVPGYGASMSPYAPVSRKEPALSLLASFFLPGLGTMINGETGKGIAMLVGYFFAVMMSVVLIGIPFVLGIWVWGMVDGYQGAERSNRRNGHFG